MSASNVTLELFASLEAFPIVAFEGWNRTVKLLIMLCILYISVSFLRRIARDAKPCFFLQSGAEQLKGLPCLSHYVAIPEQL